MEVTLNTVREEKNSEWERVPEVKRMHPTLFLGVIYDNVNDTLKVVISDENEFIKLKEVFQRMVAVQPKGATSSYEYFNSLKSLKVKIINSNRMINRNWVLDDKSKVLNNRDNEMLLWKIIVDKVEREVELYFKPCSHDVCKCIRCGELI